MEMLCFNGSDGVYLSTISREEKLPTSLANNNAGNMFFNGVQNCEDLTTPSKLDIYQHLFRGEENLPSSYVDNWNEQPPNLSTSSAQRRHSQRRWRRLSVAQLPSSGGWCLPKDGQSPLSANHPVFSAQLTIKDHRGTVQWWRWTLLDDGPHH